MCAAQATSGFHRVNQVVTRSNSGTYAQVVPGASVYVQNTSTGLAATIYSDPLLTITVPGSIVTTDFYGNYSYYLPLSTCVTENISSPSQGSLTIPNICGNAGVSLPISPSSGGTGTTTAPLSGQILVGQSGGVYAPETATQDCTLIANGTFTCLKTNGVPFTTAATTAIGTAGATIPLLSTANTWGQNQTILGNSTTGTFLQIGNTTSQTWSLWARGSADSDSGNLDFINGAGTIVLSLSNTGGSLNGSPICTVSTGCAGVVSSFSAPSASWPTWLVPTVTNATTTPTLAVAASAIPNSALANASITINSVPCALGGSCSVGSSARTCNANGCYIIGSDGTKTEWGVAVCSSGSDTCVVTFPYPFTTSANLAPTFSFNDPDTGIIYANIGSYATTQMDLILSAILAANTNVYWQAMGY
jgi:hypothetical protein